MGWGGGEYCRILKIFEEIWAADFWKIRWGEGGRVYLKLEKVKKSQQIWQILILFQLRFGRVSSVRFRLLMMKRDKH